MDISLFFQQYFYQILSILLMVFLFKDRILAKILKLEKISVFDAYEFHKKKSDSVVFLDIRTPYEIKTDPKIKQSVFIAQSEITSRIGDIKRMSKDKKLLLVCRSGSRALGTGVKLKRAGISNVYVMQGGMTAWKSANFPVIAKKSKKRK